MFRQYRSVSRMFSQMSRNCRTMPLKIYRLDQFHKMLIYENESSVEKVIENFRDINVLNAKCKIGYTPLEIATIYSTPRIIQCLIENGADPKYTDEDGISPIHLAAYFGSRGALKIFIEKGVNIECADNYGRRPLHYAVQSSNIENVRLLANYGADVVCKTHDKQCPMHIAMKYSTKETLEYVFDITRLYYKRKEMNN